ncbi:hypothetical protein FWF48_04190 [Candidatus Saccharibacteria bacterium]|nr:hypothetical protein [Candidatus Saccharibacteria bacterium]
MGKFRQVLGEDSAKGRTLKIITECILLGTNFMLILLASHWFERMMAALWHININPWSAWRMMLAIATLVSISYICSLGCAYIYKLHADMKLRKRSHGMKISMIDYEFSAISRKAFDISAIPTRIWLWSLYLINWLLV